MINTRGIWKYIITDNGLHIIERIGSVLQYAIAWVAIVAVAFIGNVPLAHAWVFAGISQVIVVEGLKRALGASTLGNKPNGKTHGFPSAHSANAFFGAVFIMSTFGWGWGLIPLLLALFVGFSRVVVAEHWPRDIAAGAIIGGVSAYTAVLHATGGLPAFLK